MIEDWHIIEGQVSGPGGAVAANAYVSVVGGSVPLPELGQRVDSSGRFKLRLPEGTFTLQVSSHDGLLKAEQALRVPRERSITFVLKET